MDNPCIDLKYGDFCVVHYCAAQRDRGWLDKDDPLWKRPEPIPSKRNLIAVGVFIGERNDRVMLACLVDADIQASEERLFIPVCTIKRCIKLKPDVFVPLEGEEEPENPPM